MVYFGIFITVQYNSHCPVLFVAYQVVSRLHLLLESHNTQNDCATIDLLHNTPTVYADLKLPILFKKLIFLLILLA